MQSRPLLATLEEDSELALERTKRRGKQAAVDVVTSVWKGTPDRCITSYADRKGVDLIATGSHHKRGLDRFLTVSTTRRVVRETDCPVLTVGPESAR